MCKFLMIARVLYDKGYQQFVDAASEIKKAYPKSEFILLGDIDESYPNHVPLEVIIEDERKGLITYLGYRSDVKDIICGVDCIVHPTYYNEGLSRVLMEALALKKPIITTDIPGCRETVINGLNGFICKPKDTNDFVKAILKFISLPQKDKQKMGEEGRYLAESVFDIQNVIKVYRSITDEYLIKS